MNAGPTPGGALPTLPGPCNGSVLLVEDDPPMAEVVSLTLSAAGLDVEVVGCGRDAIAQVLATSPDVVVLDLGLPDVDGLEVCRELRAKSKSVQIVVLTARSSTRDVVAGLDAGADDYIRKPFVVPELLARVRSALRRSTAAQGERYVAGDLVVDAEAFTASRAGRPLALSNTEFRLLLELARNAGRVCTREELLRSVWGYDHLMDSRLIDMAVKRLRARVEMDPSNPALVITVRGVGYRLDR